jgi:polygalacturonase
VTIRDCRFSRGRGAIVIGSETAGGIKNVDVSHCEIKGADRGIWIKTMRGRGGVVEGVKIDDLKMSEIVQTAIEIDMQYNRTPTRFFDATTPVVREISIRGVKCEGAREAAVIRGLEESPVSGVTLKDAKLRAVFGIAAVDAQKVTLDHVEVTTDGDGPTIWGERAADWVVDSFSTGRVPDWDAVMAFENSRGVTIRKTRAPENTDVFLELIGAATKEIRLVQCDTSKARERVELEEDVPEGAVIESGK